MSELVTPRADFAALQVAIEQNDVSSLGSLYADNAVLRIIDRNHPSGAPLELHGKTAIADYINHISSRDMTTHVEHEVIGENRLAFIVRCAYLDRLLVISTAIADLHNRKIVRQANVEARDE